MLDPELGHPLEFAARPTTLGDQRKAGHDESDSSIYNIWKEPADLPG
jgi:hypothetical protein